MTEFEKMRAGELFFDSDPEVRSSRIRAQKLCARLQTLTAWDRECREILEELIPGLPASVQICPPFHCDHGSGIILGEGVFLNYNCTILDTGVVRIGSHSQIGPNCQFYPPIHPLNFQERREPKEYARPITIGRDCWLGGGVIVCAGVTIGDRCIIGAGSVVVRDIPADSFAAGNPAVVKRSLK